VCSSLSLAKTQLVIAGHSRSKNGVAELVIGPAISGRTRWLAYGPAIPVAVALHCPLNRDDRDKPGHDGTSLFDIVDHGVKVTHRHLARALAQARSIPKHPPQNPRVPPISAVLGERRLR